MEDGKIKIAYLIDVIGSDRAGTERQLLEILRRLDRARFDPALICLAGSPWMETSALPCRHYVLGYRGFLNREFPYVVARLADVLRKERFDIVQTFFEDSVFVCFLGAMLGAPRPVLLSSRRDMGLGTDNPWYHSLFKALLPYVNRRFDRIVANGFMVRDYVAGREKTDPRKIAVIPNGIAVPPADMECPEIFHRVQADLWIGIAANLKPVKRIDLFLMALDYLKRNSPINFHALILGRGAEESSLRAMADGLGLSGKVHFMGSVDNVSAYLKNLDIGVLCSDREGLPNAVMEYMACGLPVVVTAAGGNTELVDEGNGIIVPPGDGETLGAALMALAGNAGLRKAKGAVSLQRVIERFSWDKIMEQWSSFYCSLVQQRARTG